MKKSIIFLFVLFIGFWAFLLLCFTGYIPKQSLPITLQFLDFPKTTQDVGQSLAIADGLFSSVAVVLGFIAIFLQGREIRGANEEREESMKIQIQQTKALQESIQLQLQSAQAQIHQANALAASLAEYQKQTLKLAESVDIQVKSTKALEAQVELQVCIAEHQRLDRACEQLAKGNQEDKEKYLSSCINKRKKYLERIESLSSRFLS